MILTIIHPTKDQRWGKISIGKKHREQRDTSPEAASAVPPNASALAGAPHRPGWPRRSLVVFSKHDFTGWVEVEGHILTGNHAFPQEI